MKKILIFSALFTVLAAATCKKDDAQEQGPAYLRIKNGTPFNIDSCLVNPGTWNGDHNFGAINIDALSSYAAFDSVYYYGYIKLGMNSKVYLLQPIDYVGETPYEAGHFTYKILYDAGSDRISIEFKED